MPDSARDAMAAAVKKRPLSTLLREQRQRIAALESELAAVNIKANDYARQAQEAEDVANEEHRRAEASDRKLAEARTLMIETDPHRTYRAGCPVCEFLKATRPEHSSDDPARKRRPSAESDHAECEE